MRAILPLTLVLTLALASAASALGDADVDARFFDGFEALHGESLILVSHGSLTLRGEFVTRAAADPGADGPSIRIAVAGVLTLLPGTVIRAADGADGAFIIRSGESIGMRGGRGGDVVIRAAAIVSHDALVQAGSGGAGGAALAFGNPHAFAQGGDGGDAGAIVIQAPVLAGALTRIAGHGGDGGFGEGRGEDGESCGVDGRTDSRQAPPANALGHGEAAEARGGDGSCGEVDGRGGNGGDAYAHGGHGGTASDGNGGNGGNATALAGRGGDGRHACFPSNEDAEASGLRSAGAGGHGGRIEAFAGNGGTGVIGGKGGTAFASQAGGNGGNATYPIGVGVGGSNMDPGPPHAGGVKGGDGGSGLVGGGGGGGAFAEGFGGHSGSMCGGMPWEGIFHGVPGAPLALVIVGLLVMGGIRRDS